MDIAKHLDVSISQIYKWNRDGISVNCKHYLALKELLPELEPKEILLTKYGKEDQRFRAGRKKKEAISINQSNRKTEEPHYQSALFPTIHINNKTT